MRIAAWISVQAWYDKLPEESFAPVRFRYRERDTRGKYYAVAQTREVEQLGRVRLVASHKEKDRSDAPRFFVCNESQWDLSYLLGRRQLRWLAETSYEDNKGPLGFDTYELRDEKGIGRHWPLVFAAYSAARQANAQGRWGNWLKAKLRTVGDAARQTQGEALAALVPFALAEVAAGRGSQAMLEQLMSHLRA